ncbi:hypothetical protein [Carnobacterium divergens]|uniref:hypothetical protein n=1 Tax=Carnobacterium divergens TaxID=2748 RepID=UPI0007F386DE|nr:hypothetical protein [Carnobacterium divergens]SBO17708.1 putative 3-dehydroquinate synthase family protein [Carnobacterium divergens]
MQQQVHQADGASTVFFGETLNKLVIDQMSLFQDTEQVLIVTNQKTYERYYEKLSLLFKRQELFWYICPNSIEAKSFKELLALMTYCGEIHLKKKSFIIAFGTEPVIQLASFFAHLYYKKYPLVAIPTSLEAFHVSINGNAQLTQTGKVMGSVNQTIATIFLDGRFLSINDLATTQRGFATWLQLAVSHNHDLYLQLLKDFNDVKDLQDKSMIPYVSTYVTTVNEVHQQKHVATLLGQDFQRALTTLTDGKNLTTTSDTIIGITLALIASQQRSGCTMALESWLKKMQQLGYQLALPEDWLVTDIVETLHQHSSQFYLVSKDGKLVSETIPLSELLALIIEYQELSKRSFYK